LTSLVVETSDLVKISPSPTAYWQHCFGAERSNIEVLGYIMVIKQQSYGI